MGREIHEECGVFGLYSPVSTSVASLAYYGLFALQHRGQESCGIVVNDDGYFRYQKDLGIVNEVFDRDSLASLGEGKMAVGHVRYSTSGGNQRHNAQPIVVNHIKGKLALAHNGNLINSYELRNELEMEGSIFHTTSDTEVISYIITKERLTSPTLAEAVNRAMYRIKGAYSLVMMNQNELIAVRDEHGFRPLCYGVMEDGTYVVSSETCALDAVGATFVRDIEPGEIVIFSKDGVKSLLDHTRKVKPTLCVFEYIYFARPDSSIDGCLVHDARKRAGAFLAEEHPVEADVVIGVPDSGLDAALGYAQESGIPYEIGFIKNKYIGRTFISPGQSSRENLVRIKLNPIIPVVKDKRVVVIDDSIVRGTTSARIIRLLREAGAKEVHMRVSAPPFLHPCYYGTDIDSEEHLIANKHTTEEIAAIIGADSLGYLSVEHAKRIACPDGSKTFCTSCFDGRYPTGLPTDGHKDRFEEKTSKGK